MPLWLMEKCADRWKIFPYLFLTKKTQGNDFNSQINDPESSPLVFLPVYTKLKITWKTSSLTELEIALLSKLEILMILC